MTEALSARANEPLDGETALHERGARMHITAPPAARAHVQYACCSSRLKASALLPLLICDQPRLEAA